MFSKLYKDVNTFANTNSVRTNEDSNKKGLLIQASELSRIASTPAKSNFGKSKSYYTNRITVGSKLPTEFKVSINVDTIKRKELYHSINKKG